MSNVICFGEVLWDLLPSGNIPGGAPMNVAVHLNNFGTNVQMISRVGNDNLGDRLLHFLNERGIDTSFIQKDDKTPTSVVKVFIGENKDVTYEIVNHVAWDYIEYYSSLENAVKNADVLTYGSLAARNETTRNTLLKLLPHAQLTAFDVNLRPPFYSKETLEALLEHTDILKVNHEELEEIGGWYTNQNDEATLAQTLKERFDLKMICLTRGKNGAILFTNNGSIEASGYTVEVKDTVGSGDSFLAGFLTKLLEKVPLQEALQFACATGSLVATHSGAVPQITQHDVFELITDVTPISSRDAKKSQ
jgi:fructokinase